MNDLAELQEKLSQLRDIIEHDASLSLCSIDEKVFIRITFCSFECFFSLEEFLKKSVLEIKNTILDTEKKNIAFGKMKDSIFDNMLYD